MIQFEGIGLRAPEPYDVKYIFEWENDPLQWDSSSIVSSYSFHNIEEYVSNYDPDIFATRQLRFMIVEGDNPDLPIGMIDLFDFDPLNHRAMTGFYVSETSRGKGVCSRALIALSIFCHERLSLHQLSAVSTVDNHSSLYSLKNAGFVESGTLKDWISRSNGYVDAVIMQKVLD
ncbi:MAG: GNAT family N-acetyltransferase [Muribaculaceae bacterium]|nr:GNAT family N-acetyltransferase [Muribaculaceae bacterium]